MLPKSNVPIFVYECFSEIVWYDFEPIRRLKELKEKSNKTKRKRQRYKKKVERTQLGQPVRGSDVVLFLVQVQEQKHERI